MSQSEKYCLVHSKVKALLVKDPEQGYLTSKEFHVGEKHYDYIVLFDTEYEALAFVGFKKFDIYQPALLSDMLS